MGSPFRANSGIPNNPEYSIFIKTSNSTWLRHVSKASTLFLPVISPRSGNWKEKVPIFFLFPPFFPARRKVVSSSLSAASAITYPPSLLDELLARSARKERESKRFPHDLRKKTCGSFSLFLLRLGLCRLVLCTTHVCNLRTGSGHVP